VSEEIIKESLSDENKIEERTDAVTETTAEAKTEATAEAKTTTNSGAKAEEVKPSEADMAAPKDSEIDETSVEELSESVERKRPTASEKRAENKKKKKSGFGKWLKKHKGWIIFLILVIIGLIVYFKYKSNKAAQEALANAESQKFGIISSQDITDAISTTGTIKASKTSTLYSALKDTKITAVNFEVGDHVEEGDVLVTFSDDSINKQIQEAKEDIALSQQKEAINASDRERNYVYSYGSTANSLSEAAQNVDEKLKALYEACDAYGDAKRKLTKKIEDDGAYPETREQIETQIATAYENEQKAQSAYNSAVNALAEANRKGANDLASAQSTYDTGVLTANDSVKSLQRKLEDLEDSLENYVVTSPISGTVTEVDVEAGNGFNSGNLMVVQQDDVLLVTTEIDEYDIPKVQKGQSVVIKTDATGDDELDGYVSFVSPVSSASMSSSGSGSSSSSGVTYKVEVTITSKDDRLRIGMSAKLNIIILQHTDALVVPYNAIETDENGDSYLRVVDNSQKPATADTSSESGADNAGSDSGIPVVGLDGAEVPTGTPSSSSNSGNSNGPNFDGNSNRPSFGSGGPNMPGNGAASVPSVNYKKVPVTIGIEADYYTEVISDEIKEGMQVLVDDVENNTTSGFGGPGGMGGGGMGGGMGGGPGGF